MRIPQDPSLGNVRVCDDCANKIGEHHATGFEEDLEENKAIVAQLRSLLGEKYRECEAIKRVMLEMEAEVSGDWTKLDLHTKDPESDAFAFSTSSQRVESCWNNIQSSLASEAALKDELLERWSAAVAKRTELVSLHQELSARREELDAELAEVSKTEAERDRLFREQGELERSVLHLRRRVKDLELSKKAAQERQAQRSSRLGLWSSQQALPRPITSSPPSGPVAFTISTGQQDPLLSDNRNIDRLSGCKNILGNCQRRCAVM